MSKIMIIGEQTNYVHHVCELLGEKHRMCESTASTKELIRNVRIEKPNMLLWFKNIDTRVISIKDIREEFPSIPMIVVCDEDDAQMRRNARSDMHCMFQPLKISEVVERVNELLGHENTMNPPKKKRILAVDDSGMVLRNIRQILGEQYEVTFATNGKKALDILVEELFDLILLDYEMPGMSGTEVYQMLLTADRTKDIPVVFLTGMADRKHAMEIVALHPAGYLLKPIDQDLLLGKLKEILGDE